MSTAGGTVLACRRFAAEQTVSQRCGWLSWLASGGVAAATLSVEPAAICNPAFDCSRQVPLRFSQVVEIRHSRFSAAPSYVLDHVAQVKSKPPVFDGLNCLNSVSGVVCGVVDRIAQVVAL